AVECAVVVLEARVDGIEADRLVCQQMTLCFPAHEVLQGLEDRSVDLEFAGGDLRVDLLVEHIGESAADRNLDAGIALLENLRSGFPRRGRTADIEYESCLGLRCGVEFVERLRSDRWRRSQCGECDESGRERQPANVPRHE